MKVIAIALMLFTPALAAVIPASDLEARSGTRLTQAQADALLRANGITASSAGHCTDRNNPNCTSYEGILSGTVDGIIAAKKASGEAGLIITGGTEVGHGNGPGKTHYNGYKLDVHHSPKFDHYITTTFKEIRRRSDGFRQWQAPNGIYCDEGTHWDIVYD